MDRSWFYHGSTSTILYCEISQILSIHGNEPSLNQSLIFQKPYKFQYILLKCFRSTFEALPWRQSNSYDKKNLIASHFWLLLARRDSILVYWSFSIHIVWVFGWSHNLAIEMNLLNNRVYILLWPPIEGPKNKVKLWFSATNAALHWIRNILIVLNSHKIFVGQIPSNVTEYIRKFQVKLDLMQNKLTTTVSLKINILFHHKCIFSSFIWRLIFG